MTECSSNSWCAAKEGTVSLGWEGIKDHCWGHPRQFPPTVQSRRPQRPQTEQIDVWQTDLARICRTKKQPEGTDPRGSSGHYRGVSSLRGSTNLAVCKKNLAKTKERITEAKEEWKLWNSLKRKNFCSESCRNIFTLHSTPSGVLRGVASE